MLAGLDGRERVAHARDGMAGGFDDTLHRVEFDNAAASSSTQVRPVLNASASEVRRIALLRPADPRQRRAGAADIQIGHTDHMHAVYALSLGQNHGAEFAGANQADADGLSAGGALRQQGIRFIGLPPAMIRQAAGRERDMNTLARLRTLRGQ